MQGDRRVINNLVNEKPLSSIPGVNVNLGSGAGGGGGGGSGKPGSGKMRALPGVSTFFYIGTEDGELVYVDWMPHKDQETGKMITPKPEFQFTQHEGPISFLRRSPFMPSIILMVALLSQKLFSSRHQWTAVSTSHWSYQQSQRESNRDSVEWELDTLNTRPHCYECRWVTGQM
ncbi:unnamed protein product [Protopolystoma xenopodis]|uniref:Uncharacterized protein n=1 Tax=Protopolystoma xenopodis TaxID=117903 RepID=A0A448WQI0_9PLAT|nr:unnamed protein product [Protopolystoma xenopodis]